MRRGSACEHLSLFFGAQVNPLKSLLGELGLPTLCRQPGFGFNARKVSELQ